MPAFGLIPGTVRRDRGDLPSLPLINFFAEEAITEPTGFALHSRPGLAAEGTTYGDGPITGLYQANGVLNGVRLAVSGSDIYVDGSNVGTLAGSGVVSIAGNEMGAIFTAGASVKYYDGTTLRDVAFPDSANVSKVLEQGGRFVFLRSGTHRYYWTDPLANMLDESGDIVVDGLSYASAEHEPDDLVDGLVWEDHLVLGGLATIEFHGETGNNDLPWSPTIGRVFNKGVKQTGCMTLWDNSFAWVSGDNIVYQYGGGAPLRISTAGIEELISATTNIRVTSFIFENHEFLRVCLDGRSVLFDAQTRQWMEWQSDGQCFRGGPVIQGPVFGSQDDGRLLTLSGFDDVGNSFTPSFRFGFPKDGGVETLHNVLIRCNPGQVSGTTASLRWSRDGGETWSDWVAVSLGDAGDYRTKAEWRSLGMFDQPGALLECKFDGNAQFRVSGAYYNEYVQGRSR